tara:strand:- start:1160 stop:2068 length:909 start_codon:yes stop_codon:yes gene_type:complete
MSCPNATAPINIVKNNAEVCDKKCDLAFDYPNTSVTAKNKGDYIRFAFDKSSTPPVYFNKEKYEVQEMLLFQPSLHTFSGSRTAGEVIIVHNNLNSSRTLLVCVPIEATATAPSELDALINQVAQKANTLDSTTTINLNLFSLKNIVPSKPYYYYNGTLPYSPCNGNNDIVVFGNDNSVKISGASLASLKQFLTTSSYSVHTPPNGYFYNKNGPSNFAVGDTDDIYFECNPTGSDGEILIGEKKQGLSMPADFDKYSWILGAIFGAIILYALIKVFGIAFTKIFHEPNQVGGAIASTVNTTS